MFKKAKKFLRDHINWCDIDYTVGDINVLIVDTMVSIVKTKIGEDGNVVYGRGIVLEPFMIHLMDETGDISWSSPGVSLLNWLSRS